MKRLAFVTSLLLASTGVSAQWSIANPSILNGRAEIHATNGQLRLFDTNDFLSIDYTQIERNGYGFRIYHRNNNVWTHSLTSKVNGYVGIGPGATSPLSNLHVRFDDQKELILQSSVGNSFTGISFRHNTGAENWRLRSFSNFPGGYGNMLALIGVGGGDFWISANKTLIGDSFNFSACTDCNDYKLFVRSGIRTEKVKVDIASGVWADYVFARNYDLMPLKDVELFIKENNHLPGVPSASEVEKDGLNLGEMDAKLLEKIEELTLYMIEQQKQNEILKAEIDELRAKCDQMDKDQNQ